LPAEVVRSPGGFPNVISRASLGAAQAIGQAHEAFRQALTTYDGDMAAGDLIALPLRVGHRNRFLTSP
jgi:hypothetical protein